MRQGDRQANGHDCLGSEAKTEGEEGKGKGLGESQHVSGCPHPPLFFLFFSPVRVQVLWEGIASLGVLPRDLVVPFRI